MTSDLEKSKKHDQIIHLRKIIWKSVVLKTEHLENEGNPSFGFQQVTHIPPKYWSPNQVIRVIPGPVVKGSYEGFCGQVKVKSRPDLVLSVDWIIPESGEVRYSSGSGRVILWYVTSIRVRSGSGQVKFATGPRDKSQNFPDFPPKFLDFPKFLWKIPDFPKISQNCPKSLGKSWNPGRVVFRSGQVRFRSGRDLIGVTYSGSVQVEKAE